MKYVGVILGVLFILLIMILPKHKNKGLEELKRQCVDHYSLFPQIDLAVKSGAKIALDCMYDFDQKMRVVLMDSEDKGEVFVKNFWAIASEVDAFHIIKMKKIIECHGWPTISKFGAEYDHKSWLLVQHADVDLPFQREVLSILGRLTDEGETNKRNYAYLYDRIALHDIELGGKQLYGTQLAVLTNGEVVLRPHEGTEEEMNDRREKMGLGSISDYISQFSALYSSKGN